MLKLYAVGLILLTSGCGTTMTQAGATEIAMCAVWEKSLPTRSRSDTKQTQDEVQAALVAYAAVC
jgi:hypothetical protein